MDQGVLLAGVDTVKINVKMLDHYGKPLQVQVISDELLEYLGVLQEKAQREKKSVATTMTFHDARMVILPNGASSWKYIIKNDCIQVSIVPRLNIPMVAKVTLSSAYLWKVGNVKEAIEEVHGFLIDVFGKDLLLQAAQIDLCVDVVGLELSSDWQEVFVSHARAKKPIKESQKDKEYYHGPHLETIILSGHGNPVNAKLYDKIREIIQQSKEKTWFYELWKKHGLWDEKASVWRVEFSLERAGLHEMALEDIYETIQNIKRLWFYCTHEWLRMVIPEQDKTRSRWETNNLWVKIQHAFESYDGLTVTEAGPLVRQRRREVNMDRGVAAIAGYITTLGAWDSGLPEATDIETLFSMVRARVEERWERQDLDLPTTIKEKKFLYSQKP